MAFILQDKEFIGYDSIQGNRLGIARSTLAHILGHIGCTGMCWDSKDLSEDFRMDRKDDL